MEKKMTYAVALDKAMEVVVDEEVKARLADLKASLKKKSATGEKKISEYDKALRSAVAEIMADGVARTCSDLIAIGTLPTEEGKVLSTQKIVTVLKAIGAVSEKGEKGKTYYSLPSTEVEE